jgi:endonuclease G
MIDTNDLGSQIDIPGLEERVRKSRQEREIVRKKLLEGKKPIEIDDPQRVQQWAELRGHSAAEALDAMRDFTNCRGKLYESIIADNDLLSITFLKKGLEVSKSVCCININGKHVGTGFLVGERLLLTNAHVIPDIETARDGTAEFNFEEGTDGGNEHAEEFKLCPDELFISSPKSELDYSLIAVNSEAERGSQETLKNFPYIQLDGRIGKVLKGTSLNIIQHPAGWLKQVALRKNPFTALLDQHMHYETDTLPGSSGSPVFNDRWQVVCLHHGAWPYDYPPVNEGVRISCIIDDINNRRHEATDRQLLKDFPKTNSKEQAIGQYRGPIKGEAPGNYGVLEPPAETPSGSDSAVVTFTVPLSVTISIGNVSKITSI